MESTQLDLCAETFWPYVDINCKISTLLKKFGFATSPKERELRLLSQNFSFIFKSETWKFYPNLNRQTNKPQNQRGGETVTRYFQKLAHKVAKKFSACFSAALLQHYIVSAIIFLFSIVSPTLDKILTNHPYVANFLKNLHCWTVAIWKALTSFSSRIPSCSSPIRASPTAGDWEWLVKGSGVRLITLASYSRC